MNKEEFLEWKGTEGTKRLLELIKVGTLQAVEDLIKARGEVGDFSRGAGAAFVEVEDYINTGIGMYGEET